MTCHYVHPADENNPHKLPDVETFWADEKMCLEWNKDCPAELGTRECTPGWYWWSCTPGCLPEGDPWGPFTTETEALADARAAYA